MDLLYVVEFEIAHRDDGDPFATVLTHIAEWISRDQPGTVTEQDLLEDGTARLAETEVNARTVDDRVATWETFHTSSTSAVRVSVTQRVESGLEFMTRITLISDARGTYLRVGLSRDLPGGALAPVQQTAVFQPTLVGRAARDDSLLLKTAGQVIDGRYLQVRSLSEVDAIVDALKIASRLPVLLVHVRTPSSWDVARAVSSRLVGLVRVITLNNATRVALGSSESRAQVPFGGAALIWSDLSAPAIRFSSGALATQKADGVREDLMKRIAPLSALARGIDFRWRAARTEREREEIAAMTAEVAQARGREDTLAELEALRSTVERLTAQLVEADAIVDEYAKEADELRSRADTADLAQSQLEYWASQYLEVTGRDDQPEPDEDPWVSVPDLVPGQDPESTFLALTDAAEQRLVFTDEASRSWSKITYPDPADMTAKLTALGRAAWKLYSENPGSISHIDEWFKVNHGLNVATSDDTIEKNKHLRSFTFEGKSWSQVPHVKVRDGVKPNEVGRIHFAFDTEGQRLIVSHVALKLYGR